MLQIQTSATSRNRPGDPSSHRRLAPQGVAEPFQRLRRTVHDRPTVHPQVWHHPDGGISFVDPYVRRYWTPVLGPGAIADLLRLATAAERCRPLPRPVHLPELVRAGMVCIRQGRLHVRTRIPEVPRRFYTSMPPALRRELIERARVAR